MASESEFYGTVSTPSLYDYGVTEIHDHFAPASLSGRVDALVDNLNGRYIVLSTSTITEGIIPLGWNMYEYGAWVCATGPAPYPVPSGFSAPVFSACGV